MRLIDADTLNYVRVRIYHDDGTIGGYNAVVPSSEIKNSPTVDAVPVVRCKDCKHWQYESCFVESEEGDAESIILDRFAFDFCSRAERKEECGHQ